MVATHRQVPGLWGFRGRLRLEPLGVNFVDLGHLWKNSHSPWTRWQPDDRLLDWALDSPCHGLQTYEVILAEIEDCQLAVRWWTKGDCVRHAQPAWLAHGWLFPWRRWKLWQGTEEPSPTTSPVLVLRRVRVLSLLCQYNWSFLCTLLRLDGLHRGSILLLKRKQGWS